MIFISAHAHCSLHVSPGGPFQSFLSVKVFPSLRNQGGWERIDEYNLEVLRNFKGDVEPKSSSEYAFLGACMAGTCQS